MIELQDPRWDLLSFPVSLRPVRTEVDGVTHDVPGSRCVYREDTGKVLDIVSRRYRLIPHEDIFRPLHGIVSDELPYGVRGVRTRVGLGGGYASVEWTFDHEVEVAPEDRVAVSLLARNSLDRSSALTVTLSARRLICSNGLRGPGPEFRVRWRHRRASLDTDRVLSWMREVPDRVVPMLDRWRSWNERRIFAARLGEFLEEDSLGASLVGRRDRDRIMEHLSTREGAGATVTLWQAYNALTWHATHHVRTRKSELQPLREEEVQRLALRFADHVTEN